MQSHSRVYTYQVGDIFGGFGFKTKNHQKNAYYKRLAMVVKVVEERSYPTLRPGESRWETERLALQWLDTGAVTPMSVYNMSDARIWIVSENQVAGELPRHPREVVAHRAAALRASKIPGDYQNFTRA